MTGKILIKLPPDWGLHKLKSNILLSKITINDSGFYILDRFLSISKQGNKAGIKNKIVQIENNINSASALENYLTKLNNSQICNGISNSCAIFLLENQKLCRSCSKYKYFVAKKNEKNKRKVIVNRQRSLYYLKQKHRHLNNVILNMKNQKIQSSKVDYYIKDLPQSQQEMIRTCCKAGQCKKKGNRYTLDWVYSCILMKIKSTKLYNHMRENNILPLPSPSTLSR